MVVICNVGFFGTSAILAKLNEVGSVAGHVGWPLVTLLIAIVNLGSYLGYLRKTEYERKNEERGREGLEERLLV